jgi:hypothetical protein
VVIADRVKLARVSDRMVSKKLKDEDEGYSKELMSKLSYSI